MVSWVGFLVQWHINLHGLLNAKVILVEQQLYYFTHSWGEKGVHNFHKDISPIVNKPAHLEFELTHFEAAIPQFSCPVDWGCRIHRLLLCRGVIPPLNECPGYDTKQSDGEVPVMSELSGMRSYSSWPSLPGPHWSRVVASERVLSISQIELNCVLMVNLIVWDRTVFDIETAYLC